MALTIHPLDDISPLRDLVDGPIAVVSHDKECGFDPVSCEEIQQVVCVKIGSVIKGYRNVTLGDAVKDNSAIGHIADLGTWYVGGACARWTGCRGGGRGRGRSPASTKSRLAPITAVVIAAPTEAISRAAGQGLRTSVAIFASTSVIRAHPETGAKSRLAIYAAVVIGATAPAVFRATRKRLGADVAVCTATAIIRTDYTTRLVRSR
jgi:hypothetical protein